MMMKDLVLKNRSYRRFHQDHPVEADTVRELIDMARLCASAMNLQPLKYMFSCDPRGNARVFPHLMWARQLKDWGGPVGGGEAFGLHRGAGRYGSHAVIRL